MLSFIFAHDHDPDEASRRLVAAAPGEGIEVHMAAGSTLTGGVVAPSPLGSVTANFEITPGGVVIVVTASPKYVPDAMVQSVMEDKLRRALG